MSVIRFGNTTSSISANNLVEEISRRVPKANKFASYGIRFLLVVSQATHFISGLYWVIRGNP